MTITCLNLDGGARTKLKDDHPYIANLIKYHQPHIMAFLDTRMSTAPHFNIPGYELVVYSKGDSKTLHGIGGILIYKRLDVNNDIVIHQK